MATHLRRLVVSARPPRQSSQRPPQWSGGGVGVEGLVGTLHGGTGWQAGRLGLTGACHVLDLTGISWGTMHMGINPCWTFRFVGLVDIYVCVWYFGVPT